MATADAIRTSLLHQDFAAILVQILVFIRRVGDLSEHELELKPH